MALAESLWTHCAPHDQHRCRYRAPSDVHASELAAIDVVAIIGRLSAAFHFEFFRFVREGHINECIECELNVGSMCAAKGGSLHLR